MCDRKEESVARQSNLEIANIHVRITVNTLHILGSKFHHLSFINFAKHRQKIPRMEQKYPNIMKNRMSGTNMSNNHTTQLNNIQLHVAWRNQSTKSTSCSIINIQPLLESIPASVWLFLNKIKCLVCNPISNQQSKLRQICLSNDMSALIWHLKVWTL